MIRRYCLGLYVILTLFVGVASAGELEAEVEWSRPLTLSTNLSEIVMHSAVRVGEQVKQGTLLLQLNDGVSRARVAHAKSELAYQKLLLAEAKSELQRSEELYDRTLLSDHDLDMARIAHAAAQSSYNRAQLTLREAQRDLSLRRLVAPFDARVMDLHVQQGETINGQYHAVPLVTLRALDKRRILLLVDSESADRVMVGTQVSVSVKSRTFQAKVTAISPVHGKSAGEQYELELSLDADASGLPKPGTTARVELP